MAALCWGSGEIWNYKSAIFGSDLRRSLPWDTSVLSLLMRVCNVRFQLDRDDLYMVNNNNLPHVLQNHVCSPLYMQDVTFHANMINTIAYWSWGICATFIQLYGFMEWTVDRPEYYITPASHCYSRSTFDRSRIISSTHIRRHSLVLEFPKVAKSMIRILFIWLKPTTITTWIVQTSTWILYNIQHKLSFPTVAVW